MAFQTSWWEDVEDVCKHISGFVYAQGHALPKRMIGSVFLLSKENKFLVREKHEKSEDRKVKVFTTWENVFSMIWWGLFNEKF